MSGYDKHTGCILTCRPDSFFITGSPNAELKKPVGPKVHSVVESD
jgi:hypothetical protein